MSNEYDQERESDRGNDKAFSVAEVLEMNVGAWVNGGMIAVVRKIENSPPQAKRKYWRVDLEDTVTRGATISVSLFFAPKFREGDTIEFTGKGIKRDEFSGLARVSIGKNTEIHVVDRNARQGAPLPGNTRPPPPGGADERGTPPAQHQEPPPGDGAGGEAPKSAPYIEGQTIGMALKEAIALTARCYPAVDRALPDDPQFWEQVFNTASDIARISHHMKKGHLAPSARQRVAAAKAAKNPAPAPTPTNPPPPRTPPKAQENLDEDVPF